MRREVVFGHLKGAKCGVLQRAGASIWGGSLGSPARITSSVSWLKLNLTDIYPDGKILFQPQSSNFYQMDMSNFLDPNNPSSSPHIKHHITPLPTPKKQPHILSHHPPNIHPRLISAPRQMRRQRQVQTLGLFSQQHAIPPAPRWFNLVNICCRPRDPTLPQRRHQRSLIDGPTTPDVDNHGVGSHHRHLGLADEVPGFCREGYDEEERRRAAEDFCEGRAVGVSVAIRLSRDGGGGGSGSDPVTLHSWRGIVLPRGDEDLHPQRSTHLGDALPYGPVADHPHHLVTASMRRAALAVEEEGGHAPLCAPGVRAALGVVHHRVVERYEASAG
ncbi:hypothetical protein CFIO01_11783 [Colletotrichum fioriniae PJ7]|uniref:Uncharacterized protein n=1 Tax=Colletotrichum fioriniae PJ7 TaxID=1445577 RepID=A0A010Q3Y8_9PEZI|nr:hypothetical protein CFIO01_11783 [Colletotrichum fioriniae PJ7]